MDADMERPPAPAPAQGLRPNPVVERKLAELDACLADAITSRPRRSDVDGSRFAEIQARTDFLRNLIAAAERECHGGARPEHLAEAEARFAVLQGAFDQWARRGDASPAEEEQPVEAVGSGSECSCTESCFGVEVTGGQEATSDVECEAVETTVGATFNAECKRGHKPAQAPAVATRSGTRRSGWRRSAAYCGAAGAVAVVALAVGVAIEFASVAHQNVYLVPT
ncbi:hypothetical protein E2562_033945 [Oryza meyeriana var. granulata]|uniref:DUF7610 domain-containing protein n=1 Tax=Oryza meyeriana var. granulata TaxID=110450 RepID=A0A6G1C1Q9_9ORYZ|nr:hypothetical protein E2562_033945 [Oryza meyeriana var. granulata]